MVNLAIFASTFSALATAAPSPGFPGFGASFGGQGSFGRPNWLPSFHPSPPFKPFAWPHAPRQRQCVLKALGNGQDDSAQILTAIHQCNNGGVVTFPVDQNFTIGTALDLSFLNHIDLNIQGNIKFTNDTVYWQANSFKYVYQNVTTFWKFGGNDVNVYGNGLLDGNGQAFYDLYHANALTLRPVLFGVDGLNNSAIGPLRLINSPQYYFFVQNSHSVVIDGIHITGGSTSQYEAKNTDGIDTYRSDNIVIQNWNVNNGDDCVSFKPNSTNMVVQNMVCNGSHGISVGSLGQYKGEVDIVENIYVYNISMSNAQNGARIKVWPGVPSALSTDLQGGGGSGYVKNITFDTFYNFNNDWAITLTGCYGQNNFTLCQNAPSNMTMSDITFKGFTGTTSKANNPFSGNIVCSSKTSCSNIVATDINVTSPAGNVDAFTCADVDTSKLAVNCTLPKGWIGV